MRGELLGQPLELLDPGAVSRFPEQHRSAFFVRPYRAAHGPAYLPVRRKDGSEFPSKRD
ncbi:MAG: hypothetical protein R3A10_09485 [Caldilineaceae bacterium]